MRHSKFSKQDKLTDNKLELRFAHFGLVIGTSLRLASLGTILSLLASAASASESAVANSYPHPKPSTETLTSAFDQTDSSNKQLLGGSGLITQLFPSDPVQMNGLIQLGNKQFSQGQFQAARQTYSKAIIYAPTNVSLLIKLAAACEKCGDLDEAIKWARKSTLIEPTNSDVHMELAKYLEANRDQRGAILQYERALDLSDTKKQKLSLYRKIVSLLVSNGDLNEAYALSEKWLKENKHNAECHFNYAFVLAQSKRKGRLEEAEREFTKCLALESSLNLAHYQLALVKLSLRDEMGAKDELKVFIKNHPSEKYLGLAQELIAQIEADLSKESNGVGQPIQAESMPDKP